jgi:hypothetical protein
MLIRDVFVDPLLVALLATDRTSHSEVHSGLGQLSLDFGSMGMIIALKMDVELRLDLQLTFQVGCHVEEALEAVSLLSGKLTERSWKR